MSDRNRDNSHLDRASASGQRARNLSRSAQPQRPQSRSPVKHRERRTKEDTRQARRRYPSTSPRRRSRSPRRSTSPKRHLAQNDESAIEKRDKPLEEKQRPNFQQSGKLAAETNTVLGTGIVLKYNEPPEARKPPPSQAWRMYVFRGTENLEDIELYQKSCWLFGRERLVADYHVEHPSLSKQHAVVQFRYVENRNEFGDRTGLVKPYLIDLDSSNGTRVNGKDMPSSRYYELRSEDVVTFGDSTREYVIMLPPKD